MMSWKLFLLVKALSVTATLLNSKDPASDPCTTTVTLDTITHTSSASAQTFTAVEDLLLYAGSGTAIANSEEPLHTGLVNTTPSDDHGNDVSYLSKPATTFIHAVQPSISASNYISGTTPVATTHDQVAPTRSQTESTASPSDGCSDGSSDCLVPVSGSFKLRPGSAGLALLATLATLGLL